MPDMVDGHGDDIRPPPVGATTLFVQFLRSGFLAFGAPVAKIAMIRRESRANGHSSKIDRAAYSAAGQLRGVGAARARPGLASFEPDRKNDTPERAIAGA